MAKISVQPEKGKPFEIDLLADRVLVQPDTAREKTRGGIIIPDTAKDSPMRGTVVALGEGTKEKPVLSVQMGEKVMYSKYAGMKIKINGTNYIVCRETDLWSRIDPDAEIEAGE